MKVLIFIKQSKYIQTVRKQGKDGVGILLTTLEAISLERGKKTTMPYGEYNMWVVHQIFVYVYLTFMKGPRASITKQQISSIPTNNA